MALGDGTTWDETEPTDLTEAVNIDNYNRDLRAGVRGRMAREHEFPAAQSVTSEAGAHKFITMQEQGSKPTLSGTQKAAVYTDTSNNLSFEKSDGTVIPIVVGTGIPMTGKILVDSTATASGYLVDVVAGIISTGTDSAMVVGFGAWVDKSLNYGAQEATTDGFVVGYVVGTGNNEGAEAYLYSDSNANPTTKRQGGLNADYSESAGSGSVQFNCPVRKGDYWKLVVTYGATVELFWIPTGV